MVTTYILFLILVGMFGFASYHAIVNGYVWATWVTELSLFALFAFILAAAMISSIK